MPMVGKSRCAEELGWHRQVLDRRLDRDHLFPRQAGPDGRTLFNMDEVWSYLDGRPRPALAASLSGLSRLAALETQGEPTAAPSLRLFDEAAYEAATAALRPRGLPIAESEPCRREGLTNEQMSIVAGFVDLLPRRPSNSGFRDALRKATKRVIDHVADEILAFPGDLDIQTARELAGTQFRMLGALFDAAEFVALAQANGDRKQREAVRLWFDGLRANMVEDCQRAFC